MLHVFGIYGRLLSNILVVKEICSVMDSKYPTAWRPLLRDVVKIRQERDETKPAAKLRSFLLFVRLPTWRTQVVAGNKIYDSPNHGQLSVPEIRTLPNITNGTEIFAMKIILELSCGIPAHIINLVDIKDNILDDKTKLELGKNINNAGTLCIKLLPQWDDIVRHAWLGNNRGLLNVIPKLNTYQGQSWNDLETNKNLSLREHSFCALFVASARGNSEICETILKCDFDPNQTSILGNTAVHCAAFHGQIEVLKLLVAYGTNIRIRNIKNQSALDVAVSRGFIDCARWLWLNQWSISITRKQSPKSTPVKQKRVDNEHLLTTTPAKKFFQKSNQDFLLEKSLEKINKEHGHIRPNSSVYLNPTKLYNEVKARPKSSIHYERKIKNHQNTNKRNQASFISTSILPPHIRIPTPSSIPSKYNSRMQVQNPRIDNRFQVKLSEQEKGRSQLLKQSLQMKHKLFRANIPNPISVIKTNQTFEMYSKSQQDFTKKTKISLQPDNHHLNQLQSSISNFRKVDQIKTVPKPTVPLRSVTPSVLKPTYIKDQPNSEYIDVIQEISPLKKTNSTSASSNKSNPTCSTDQEKSKNSEFLNYLPATTKENKCIVREKNSNLESFQNAQKERFAEIRRQRNEHAFSEWMAAKQRQKKRKENQNDDGTCQYDVKPKFGKTFDEWLEEKNNQQHFEKETTHHENIDKRNKPAGNGMSFEEWTKEKKEHEKTAKKNVEIQEQDETELRYLRESKFSTWVEKKNREQKYEKRKIKILEQEKLSDMKDFYETWKTRKRVLSFQEWIKRKENDKRLNEIDVAQRELDEDLDVWMEMNRKMKADAAFHKWLLRKESLSLEQAEKELEDAKHLRARAERKAKLKRAFRKAKMMVKWRRLQSGDNNKAPLSELIYRIEQLGDFSSSDSNSDGIIFSDEAKYSIKVVEITQDISAVDDFKVVVGTDIEDFKSKEVEDNNENLKVDEVDENASSTSYIETQHLHGVNTNPSPEQAKTLTKIIKKNRNHLTVKKKTVKKRRRGNVTRSSTNVFV